MTRTSVLRSESESIFIVSRDLILLEREMVYGGSRLIDLPASPATFTRSEKNDSGNVIQARLVGHLESNSKKRNRESEDEGVQKPNEVSSGMNLETRAVALMFRACDFD